MPRLRRPLSWLAAGLTATLVAAWARPRTPRAAPRPTTGRLQPRRVLAVKLADIGDAIGIEPALVALRAGWPDADLDVLVTPGARAALSTGRHHTDLIDFDKHLFDSPLALLHPLRALAAWRLLWTLRRTRYDVLILFHHLATAWGALKFRLVAMLVGAPVVAGLENGRGGFLTVAAPDFGFGAMAEWRYWLTVVAALGPAAVERPPAFAVPSAAQATADALLAEVAPSGRRKIALHIGVGGYAPIKQWPEESFVVLARQLIDAHTADILLVGGPDLVEATERIGQALGPRAIALAGRTSLPVLAGLLTRCALLVGNDSGLVHLADAVGCPTLAIFGPTNADAWAPGRATVVSQPADGGGGVVLPIGVPRSVVLRRAEPCSPCYYTGFSVHERGRCAHRNCLVRLAPSVVAGVAEQILAAHETALAE